VVAHRQPAGVTALELGELVAEERRCRGAVAVEQGEAALRLDLEGGGDDREVGLMPLPAAMAA
jgi:hypothetical protein